MKVDEDVSSFIDGQWGIHRWTLNDTNVLTFDVTSQTPDRISGTFTGRGSYLRYTDAPLATQYTWLEIGSVNISGTWSAQRAAMPVIQGADGHTGCAFVRVLNLWTAYDYVQRRVVNWQGNPTCTVTFPVQ